MNCRRRMLAAKRDGAGSATTALLAIVGGLLLTAAPAGANVGYEPPAFGATIATGAELQHGIAINQVSHEIHVAVIAKSKSEFGEIRRFNPAGTITGNFSVGPGAVFSGVAVNPVTQGVYGVEGVARTPFGAIGTPRIDVFSSTGTLGTTFATSDTEGAPQAATDSAGLVYFPNAVTNSVQAFNASGALQKTILCTGCPGGAFGQPMSVALDSEDDLYVVDLSPDRVVKFVDTGSGYVFDSVLQSGRGATGVGVDPSTDDVFVSDIAADGRNHIVAYDSSGAQFDDFGAGLAKAAFPEAGSLVGPQVAADSTSHKLYVTSQNQLFVFDRVTIAPPVVTTDAASGVAQLGATLQATINAKGHAVLVCDFEYVDDAEFLAEGFTSPTAAACSKKPDGTSNVVVTAGLSGLSPATKYHFRAVATSNAGTSAGNTQTFTTLPSVPPTVTTDPDGGVTETGATLIGRVNPHGGTVSDCHFEYGVASSYGTNVPCATKVGPATTEVTSKVTLKGLSSATEYHYRLVVTTNAGSASGDDVTFTTTSPPPPAPEPSPLAPGPEASPPPLPPTATSCKAGFVKLRIGGKASCVKRCRKGFVRKKVRGRFKCVKRPPRRPAGRR
jgi:hypothetical protein